MSLHRMIHRGLPAVLVSALALGSLVACGGDNSDDAGGESGNYAVLALLPVSGPLNSLGEAAKQSLVAQAEVLNASGGIGGKPIKITVADTTGTATEAVGALQKALSSGSKPDLVYAGVTSTEAVPMLPILSKAKVISMTAASAEQINQPDTVPYSFTLSPTSHLTAEPVVAELTERGLTEVGGLYTDNELGRSNEEALAKAAADAGIEFDPVFMDPAATDATAELSRLRTRNPQALVVSAYGPTAAAILKSRKQMGWTTPVIGDIGFSSNNLPALAARAELAGVTALVPAYGVKGSELESSRAFQAFYTALQKRVPDITQVIGAYYSGTSLLLARAAVDEAGSTDADDVKAALESFSDADDVKDWWSEPEIGFSSTNHSANYPSMPITPTKLEQGIWITD